MNDINDILNIYLKTNKIPNIIFYGPSGCGKKYIVDKFITNIYGDNIKNTVMKVECGLGKGIRFIRNEIKYFAKQNIHKGYDFKCIILYNADQLTADAQSALRRCIEIFSHSTRFFIVIDNIHTLLNPIASRFTKLYINYRYTNNKIINYNKIYIHKSDFYKKLLCQKKKYLANKLKLIHNLSMEELFELTDLLYNKGITGDMIYEYIHKNDAYNIAHLYDKYNKELKDEKLIIQYILIMLRNYQNLDFSGTYKHG